MPLYQHVIVGRRIVRPVRGRRDRPGRLRGRAPRAQGQPRAGPRRPGRLGPAARIARPATRPWRQAAQPRPRATPVRAWTPSRSEVVDALDAGRAAARPSSSSSAGSAATPPSQQCLQRQPAADHPEERDRDLRVRRGALLQPPRRGPPGTRLPRVPRRAHARDRRPPRRHAADLQGVRRGAVPAGSVPGRLRHRDAGAGHQHARAVGGDREAVQVERRDPRRHHAGGVHPAHRPRRPPRHRRRGPRRRPLAAGARPEGGGRSRLDPHLPAQVVASGRRTTWRSTWSTSSAASVPASCSSRPSRSSRPTRPWSGSPGSCARARTRSTGTPRPRPATAATSWSTPGCGTGSPRPRRTSPGRGAPTGARR